MANVKFTGLVDRTMQKYGIPEWLKPYVFTYIKSNPVNAIRHATSFVEIRRKKGEITRDHVKLPNGLTFKTGFIEEILGLFNYGEERISEIYTKWSREPGYDHLDCKNRFAELSQLSKRHLRAIGNLMEGISIRPKQPRKEIMDLFDYIESVSDWDDRVVVSGIFIKYSFSYPFGFVFYKVFYPVAPEFMRSFGKAFTTQSEATAWLDSEAKAAVSRMDESHLLGLSRSMLSRTATSIGSEMQISRSSGIESEVKLLRDIALAYPLHVLRDLGVSVDVDKEVRSLTKS